MEKRIVDDPNVAKMKKKERIALLESVVGRQKKIIDLLKTIISSPDPHLNYGDNNLAWVEIKLEQEMIDDAMAKLNGKKIEYIAYRPVVGGEMLP